LVLFIDVYLVSTYWIDGLFWRSWVQVYDVLFLMQWAYLVLLYVNGVVSNIYGEAVVLTFDDCRLYWSLVIFMIGVKVLNAGV